MLRDFINPGLDSPSVRVVNAAIKAWNGVYHKLRGGRCPEED